jgi:hypothetical protein
MIDLLFMVLTIVFGLYSLYWAFRKAESYIETSLVVLPGLVTLYFGLGVVLFAAATISASYGVPEYYALSIFVATFAIFVVFALSFGLSIGFVLVHVLKVIVRALQR